MKIALINPPFRQNLSFINSKKRRAMLEIVQPLGLAYIAAMLEKDNYIAKIFDCSLGISEYELISLLAQEKSDIIGITATSLSLPSAKSIAFQLRTLFPGAFIIIGGPHITASPEDMINCRYFDAGVIGEGEETFLELVKSIEKSGLDKIADIAGLVYVRDGSLVVTRKRDFISDLNAIPFPARHLLAPLSEYFPFPASYRSLPLATLVSSRGCPMGCTFCDQAVFGPVYRSRSVDNILEEVGLLINKFRAREIRFYDDIFTFNNRLTEELCEEIIKRNLRFSWTCFCSVNTINKGLLKKMKQAGCWQVSFGLESGDARVLRALKKNISLEENEKGVRLAREAGLSIRAHFVVGSPWETKESLQKTLDFAKRTGIDYAHFIKFMPYPGSQAYRMLTENGHIFNYDREFSMLDNEDIMYVPASMTKEELTDFLNRAKREFYLRLSYILKRIFSVRTWLEIKALILASVAFFIHYNTDKREKNTPF